MPDILKQYILLLETDQSDLIGQFIYAEDTAPAYNHLNNHYLTKDRNELWSIISII